jgi:uncharacterized membrane protein YciS (DUF1049 family)
MSFGYQAAKLFTNKYFLYFIVFLAVTNVLGYIVTNNIRAVMYFALISLLTSYFSNNMAVILLVGMITTNLLVSKNFFREGLENKMPISTEDEEKLVDVDEKLKKGIDALKKTNGDVSKAKEIIENNNDVSDKKDDIKDPNNPEMNKVTKEPNEPIPSDVSSSNKKSSQSLATQGFTNLYG